MISQITRQICFFSLFIVNKILKPLSDALLKVLIIVFTHIRHAYVYNAHPVLYHLKVPRNFIWYTVFTASFTCT